MQITLKAARVNKGLTQREAAKYLKVNFQTISKYEIDSSKIPMKLLKDMCSLYKIPMNYIILGKSTKKKRTKIITKGKGETPTP